MSDQGDAASANRLPPAVIEPASFDDMEGWAGDDHAAALACFRISAKRMVERPYSSKALGVDAAALAALAPVALTWPGEARTFFERSFQPFRVAPADSGTGFVTGYYEPEVEASPVRTARFGYPLYRRPPDLVGIDDATRPPGMDPYFMFARLTELGLLEYPDRSAIESGALNGRGLELAWIEDPVDGFFIHIQGSARLRMPDGSTWRISYDGKTGHPFTPVGRLLIESGEMRREDVTADAIADWLRADRVRGRRMMNRNRSFIFFRLVEDSDPSLGPVAAASVPLTPGRSLAADHRLHTFGTPVFVSTTQPLPGADSPLRRLMIVQDTGSAIVGPARGDLFIGSGREAGAVAGAVKHAASFVVLFPRPQGSGL